MGPGKSLFDAISRALGEIHIIAEDLVTVLYLLSQVNSSHFSMSEYNVTGHVAEKEKLSFHFITSPLPPLLVLNVVSLVHIGK